MKGYLKDLARIQPDGHDFKRLGSLLVEVFFQVRIGGGGLDVVSRGKVI